MQIIIPMAGIGKRFIEAGYKDPKPLIEVDGKPMIQHVYELFNIKNTTFICNEKHFFETDIEMILRNICPTCKIFTVSNEDRKGPVDAVIRIFNSIDDFDEVIVSYCDFGTFWNYDEFLIQARKADGAIACYTGFHPHMLGSDNYAFVKMDGEYAAKIQEKKPFTNDRMSELASNGIYYFKSGKILKHYFQKLYDQNITVNGEFYVSEVYNLMIEDGLKVVCPLINKMLQWGTPSDLEIYKKWSNCFNYKKQEEDAICCPNTTLILPMAGKGSRFTDAGYTIPKPLLPVDNEYMFTRAINCLPKCDTEIFIVRDEHMTDDIYMAFSERSKNKSVEIINLSGEYTQGQACTCDLGMSNVVGPVLISSCDNGALYNHKKWNELINSDVDVIVWSFRNNQTSKLKPNMYSWLKVDENDNILNVSCKKLYEGADPLTTHAIIGTFFYRNAEDFRNGLNKNIEENITTNGEFYVDDIINQNIKAGLKVKLFEVDHYICWGTPNDYKTYNYWSEYFNAKL